MGFYYVCKNCHRRFDDAEIDTDNNNNDCCPFCGSDDISQQITYKYKSCDCCHLSIRETEPTYRIDISRDGFPEHILKRVCSSCYSRFRLIIDNAEIWNKIL